MSFAKLLSSALALAALITSPDVSGQFDCMGEGNCNIAIDGLSDACITQIEITSGPLQVSTGTVSLSICDYKVLDGSCFDLGLDSKLQKEVPCQIVQEREPTGYRFIFKTYVTARVPGYSGTFSGDLLLLKSLNTFPKPLGDNQVPIVYSCIKDVILSNDQGNTLVLKRGSNVEMTTSQAKIICMLVGQCEVVVGGQQTSINPLIEIETETPVAAGPGVRVSAVVSKVLHSDIFTMRLDPGFESSFVLRSAGPDGDKVTAELHVVIDYKGAEYRAAGPLVLESDRLVHNFPGSGIGYRVQARTEFVNDNGDVIVIVRGQVHN